MECLRRVESKIRTFGLFAQFVLIEIYIISFIFLKFSRMFFVNIYEVIVTLCVLSDCHFGVPLIYKCYA